MIVSVSSVVLATNEEGASMKKVVSEISGTVFSLPWLIAKDHGLFEAEGIDMEFVRARTSGAVTHTEDPSEVNPILGHVAFEEARVSIYRA
jgi:NitT/TauT family transport system substrate-binding protein